MNYKQELDTIYRQQYSMTDYNLNTKNIVIYGAGSLGHMACNLLLKSNIMPKYIVDKNREGDINKVKIVDPKHIEKRDLTSSLFLVCISSISYNNIISYLESLGIKHTIHFYTYAYLKFPGLLSNGWFCNNLTEYDKAEIEKVCNALSHDELSLHHYLQFLWWKLCGIEKEFDKYPVLSEKKYFKAPCVNKLTDEEVLIDAGCHFGQTIESFIEATSNEFNKIYAFEPDEENLTILKQKFNDKRIVYSNKVIFNKNCGIQFQSELGFASKINEHGEIKEAITIDSLNLTPTIIKLHIEGSELQGLEGAEKTIKKHHPKIMTLADHNSDGLYKIPTMMYGFSYKLYFYLHDYCGNSAIFYAIH